MVVFRNRKAAYLWGVMGAFMGIVAAMSYVLLRDGPPSGYSIASTAATVGLFWIGGLGGSAFAASHACVTVTVQPNATVRIVHQYPFRRDQQEVYNERINRASVVESRDAEGDPYYFARAALIDGAHVDLYEAHDRQRCESACARFNQAVFGTSPCRVAP
jgi:hypothetical protein